MDDGSQLPLAKDANEHLYISDSSMRTLNRIQRMLTCKHMLYKTLSFHS